MLYFDIVTRDTKKSFFFLSIGIILFCSIRLNAQSFTTQGSDLLMGVGAKDIARSGASVANSHDIYASFWNPAGLSEISSGEVGLSRQIEGTLAPINFFAIAYLLPFDKLGFKMVVAFAYIPRLYVKASGAFYERDIESVFLRYTLPGLSGNFDGEIDSATDDYKLAVGISPLHNVFWSIGASIGYVNCATTFAGVTMEDPTNFQNISTVATTFSYGFGAKIYASDTITLGLNVKNINNKLAVAVDIVDDDGYAHKSYDVSFPLDVTIGADWRYSDDIDVAIDFQRVSGAYGDYTVDFQVLRIGSTLSYDTLDYHFGLIAPIKIASSTLENIDPIFPVAPTAGFGWHNETFDVSMAFYVHPIMSLYKNSPSPSMDISLAYHF